MIKDAGGRAIAMNADASNEADVAKAVDTAVKEFGRLDAIYANAGISGGLGPSFFEATAEDWMTDPVGQSDRRVPGDQACLPA